MQKFAILALLASTLVAASPTIIQKRVPSDKSGASTMSFTCDDATIPNPGGASGEGEGGTGLFTTDMKFNASGNVIYPSACTTTDFCYNCLV